MANNSRLLTCTIGLLLPLLVGSSVRANGVVPLLVYERLPGGKAVRLPNAEVRVLANTAGGGVVGRTDSGGYLCAPYAGDDAEIQLDVSAIGFDSRPPLRVPVTAGSRCHSTPHDVYLVRASSLRSAAPHTKTATNGGANPREPPRTAARVYEAYVYDDTNTAISGVTVLSDDHCLSSRPSDSAGFVRITSQGCPDASPEVRIHLQREGFSTLVRSIVMKLPPLDSPDELHLVRSGVDSSAARIVASQATVLAYEAYVRDETGAALEGVSVSTNDPCLTHLPSGSDGLIRVSNESCLTASAQVRIRLEREGYVARTETVVIKPAPLIRTDLKLSRPLGFDLPPSRRTYAPPTDTEPRSSTSTTLGIASSVGAGVSLAAVGVFWALREKAAGDFNEATGCGEKLDRFGASGCDGLHSKVTTFETARTVSAVAAGGLGIAALYFLAFAPPSELGVIAACSSYASAGLSCKVHF